MRSSAENHDGAAELQSVPPKTACHNTEGLFGTLTAQNCTRFLSSLHMFVAGG